MDRAKALSNGYILLFDEKILPAAVQRDFKAVIPAGYAGEHHRLHQEGWGGLVFFLGDPQKVFGSFLQLVLGTRADQIPAGGEDRAPLSPAGSNGGRWKTAGISSP